jgi:hypothetical protein
MAAVGKASEVEMAAALQQQAAAVELLNRGSLEKLESVAAVGMVSL